MRARVVLFVGLVGAAVVAGVLDGCGGDFVGHTGAAGTTGGVGGASGTFAQPPCQSIVVKGGACTPADQQFCYQTCGPQSIGAKSETCTSSGFYAEMAGCVFDPDRSYSCYKIPAAASGACLSGVKPRASSACDVAACAVCNSTQGLVGGQYLDSAGVSQVGYCVCQPPNSSGLRTWSCASDITWPCPMGSGC